MTNEFKLKHTHYSDPLETYNLHQSFKTTLLKYLDSLNNSIYDPIHNNALEIAHIVVDL